MSSLEDSSCEEIEVGDCLDYKLSRDEFLKNIVKKLRYGGILRINGIDLDEVIYQHSVGDISFIQMQRFLYGGRMNTDFLGGVFNKLKSLGLTVTNSNLNGSQYFIAAERQLPMGN